MCYYNKEVAMNLLIIFLSILPIYLIGLYYYKKDTIKEPKSLLKKLFFCSFLLKKLFVKEEISNICKINII